ncbi:hypothetical protein AMELA_G00111120 [Ameiurus melas]|uniref:Uncharacterized protein n=1 Tax=Ameiurus melas TaxID=219545 RepID=A0A7J6APR9_AMEME|nr:hypothetical protein AMELA_G00111120 [Ameiurus melas]
MLGFSFHVSQPLWENLGGLSIFLKKKKKRSYSCRHGILVTKNKFDTLRYNPPQKKTKTKKNKSTLSHIREILSHILLQSGFKTRSFLRLGLLRKTNCRFLGCLAMAVPPDVSTACLF